MPQQALFHTSRRALLRFVGACAVAIAAATLCAPPALAQTTLSTKISKDLREVIAGAPLNRYSWANDLNGVRLVKAIVVAVPGSDPEMANLRSTVLAAGGSVSGRYTSVAALSVMLPANRINDIALRSDVQTVSPNRMTSRTASLLEMASGASSVRGLAPAGAAALDGSGVGIAVLDSGVMINHQHFSNAAGASRINRSVDLLMAGDSGGRSQKNWTAGVDVSAGMFPGSSTMARYESKIGVSTSSVRADRYGHGSHVASVAAGRGAYQALDSTGVAPNANLFDVKVLDDKGYGQISDVLAGIDWVMYHAREYNIRVMNLSLAADSTESWQTDPLARAARSAVAAGITVVVAAGNFGKGADGVERFGTIGSPGHDPSVITVGSANTRATAARSDDSVNLFSSRGPTRGAYTDASGVRRPDNLLKPDLVAPGNKVIGVRTTVGSNNGGLKLAELPASFPALMDVPGGSPDYGRQLMMLSGTSVAAPVVAGAAALLLQANPGLTPPLIKAILQYSAQPIAGAHLLQQGAGLLNIDGAVRLAQALRTDIASAVASGSITAGANLLAVGKSLPQASSTLNGQSFGWSKLVSAGGSHLLSGDVLFSKYQPIYDPKLTWVRDIARRNNVSYWPASSGVAANTFPRSVVEVTAPNQALVTPGVVWASGVAGSSSRPGNSGAFMPTGALAGWLNSGSGSILSRGFSFSNGLVLGEGVAISEGVVISEGVAISEGFILAEGFVLSEGFILAESGQPGSGGGDDAAMLGEN